MKIKFFSIALLVTVLMSFTADKPLKIIFFGDSITQAGVSSGGYITLAKGILEAKGKSMDIELVGAGISGNKVYDLYLRIEEDVLSKAPDAVLIYIGVNDVWHKNTSGTGTDANKFEGFYNALIKKMQDKGIKVICVTPAAIGERTDFSNAQDGDLNFYSNMIRRIAKEKNCGLVDLRKEFLDYNLKNNKENLQKGILTTDGVHLNETGNKFVAELMLRAIGVN